MEQFKKAVIAPQYSRVGRRFVHQKIWKLECEMTKNLPLEDGCHGCSC